MTRDDLCQSVPCRKKTDRRPKPEKSIVFMPRHGSPIGRDPIIAVYNMAALPPRGPRASTLLLSPGLSRNPIMAVGLAVLHFCDALHPQ